MIKKILSLFGFAPLLFSFALVIYLLLFLLENLFPGFVSNNFDLNNLLLPVFILGFLSALSPIQEEEEEKHATASDYKMVGILAVVAFFILWIKTRYMGIEGLVIALVGSGLVVLISYVLFSPEESLEELTEKEINYSNISHLAYNLNVHRRSGNPLHFFGKIKIPVSIIFAVFILFLLFNKNVLHNKIGSSITPTPQNVQPTQKVEYEELPFPSPIATPSASVLALVPITVLNGSTKVGSASAMADFLRKNNFIVSKASDADATDYLNAVVRFRPEDILVADYLSSVITPFYSIVERVPLSTESAGVILILGNQY